MNKSALRTIAASGPWLSPIPSAYFIGRAIYAHLLDGWGGSLQIPPALNLGVAVVSGAVVEILAIVSIHNALALNRWNGQGRVKKDKGGWERAPMWQALTCAGMYLVTALLLLVVLEAWPHLSQYAPILFPFLAVVGALNLAILDEHKARLERYGLEWDLSKRKPSQTVANRRKGSETDSAKRANASDLRAQASEPERITCDFCDWERNVSEYESELAAQNALNAHMKKHRRGPDG
jgi:hypothetical protein